MTTTKRPPNATFQPPVTLGVLADTHVPDRVPQLPPAVLEVFREAGVQAILHAGDVSHPAVLRTLEAVAPVYAVRGNLDFFLRLPLVRWFRLGPYTMVLLHGHMGWRTYLWDKLRFHLGRPLRFRELERRAFRAFPQAHIVVMGHTHAPALWGEQGRWLFNPGSPTNPPAGAEARYPRTVGLIHLDRHHRLHFEWVWLA